jgi:hypothetical protein
LELLFSQQIVAVSEWDLNLVSIVTGRPISIWDVARLFNLAITAPRSIQMKACVHSPVREKAWVHSPVHEHVKFSWQPCQIHCNIMEVPISSLVALTACLDSILTCFSLVSLKKLWKATEITSRHLSSTYFPAYYPSVIPLLTSYSLRYQHSG